MYKSMLSAPRSRVPVTAGNLIEKQSWCCFCMWGEFIDPIDVPDRFWTPRGVGDARRYVGSLGDDSGCSSGIGFSLWSWNARSLFGVDVAKAKRKQDVVRAALHRHDFVLIQEAHCNGYLEQDFSKGM